MLGKSRSEVFASVEQYGKTIIGLLTIIAGSLLLIALGIWGGAGR